MVGGSSFSYINRKLLNTLHIIALYREGDTNFKRERERDYAWLLELLGN